jgi:hypothetical protein
MSELESYFLVGRFEGENRIFLQSLNVDVVPEELSDEDVLVFRYLCAKAGTVPCCTIRTRREQDGELVHYCSFFKEPASEDDTLAKSNALLRIVAQEKNPLDPEGEAQAIAADAQILAELNADATGEGEHEL